jgi:type I restriction enzyme S subunit
MMSSRVKVPQIRFEGFSGEWEENIVGEYYSFKNGLNKGKEFFGYGTPIVNFTDVFHNRGINAINLKGKVFVTSEEISNYNVEQGDILFTRTSETINEIGYPSVMLDKVKNIVFSGFVLRARANTFDPLSISFKQYVFFTDSFRSEMVKKSSMTTRALTSGTAIKQMFFSFPKNKKEQSKIGNYFQNLDNLIAKKEKKYQKLKDLKKAMLDKMFPKGGSDVPDVRFEGFSEKWEERKLGDITKQISYGLTIRPDYTKVGIPLISARELNNNKINYDIAPNISEYSYNKLSEKAKAKKGDIFLTKTGTIGLTGYVTKDIPIAITQNIAIIRLSPNKYNHYFLLQYFQTSKFYQQVLSKINKSTIMDLQLQDIRNFLILFPNIKEQTKIGNYFQKLDKLIELQKKEIDKLKNIKKASLENMFV